MVAAVLGCTVLWGSGWGGGTLLAVFFLSGSLLSYGRRPSTRAVGPGRTWRQVLANGGWAAIGALLVPHHPLTGWSLLAGSLAAAQADTWGTEVGRLSRRQPRLLIGGDPVPPGTSGGVTWLGTAAGAAGAGVIGTLVFALGAGSAVAAWSAAGGVLGTLTDSALGATIQARYRCDVCELELECPKHECPGTAQISRGSRWVDNDVVNGMAAGVGGAVAAIGVALTT